MTQLSTPAAAPRVIAAFDFDGTLTRRDTLIPFLARVSLGRLIAAIMLAAPALIGYALNLWPRGRAKQTLCSAALRGKPRATLTAIAHAWVDNIALRPHSLERLKWHQAHGHHCVLISASLDVYLEVVAERLGFDDLLCTGLAVDAQNRVTGKFAGPNCWGPEKVLQLQKRFGPPSGYELYAYGDSLGDRWLLDVAQHAWFREEKIKP
jgi:phosphatidylglycerophosphatase C